MLTVSGIEISPLAIIFISGGLKLDNEYNEGVIIRSSFDGVAFFETVSIS